MTQREVRLVQKRGRGRPSSFFIDALMKALCGTSLVSQLWALHTNTCGGEAEWDRH